MPTKEELLSLRSTAIGLANQRLSSGVTAGVVVPLTSGVQGAAGRVGQSGFFKASDALAKTKAARTALATVTDDTIAATYSAIFEAISASAAAGESSLVVSIAQQQYNELGPLLTKLGYSVSFVPAVLSGSSFSNTGRSNSLTIRWE